MRLYMCIDMDIDMGKDVCIDLFIGMCIDTRIDTHTGICVVAADMCVDMCHRLMANPQRLVSSAARPHAHHPSALTPFPNTPCVRVCVRACVCACVRACVCACVRA